MISIYYFLIALFILINKNENNSIINKRYKIIDGSIITSILGLRERAIKIFKIITRNNNKYNIT